MKLQFETCELDVERHQLLVDGTEAHVEPQVFDLLALLAGSAPDLVTYDKMVEVIWNGRIVSDATIAARISAARHAVGDNGKAQRIIRTVPRRGVQMVPRVERLDGPVAGPVPTAPMQTLTRQTIRYTSSRDGTGLAWAESGEGPPLLRAGHWMSHLDYDWTSPVWQPLLERQSNGRRLIRYDPRGTGLSDRDVDFSSVTIEELADDLEAVADAAGLERFPIYAISQSVPVALAFAARRPDRVSRLILNNGLVQGSNIRGESGATEAMIAMIRAGWGIPDSPFMRAIATVFIPRSTPEELESLVQSQSRSASPDTAAEIRRVIGDIDITDILHKVTTPALVMHCSGDAVQSAEQSKQIARSLPNAEFALCDSPNHMVVPSDPIWAPCMDAFDQFLDQDAP